MVKRSRLLRSSSVGATSPLDKMFCFDPADTWEVKSAPTRPPQPPPSNPAVTDRPMPPPSPPPSPSHAKSETEVVEALPPMSKARIASPGAPFTSEARTEAPEGTMISPVTFSLDPSSLEPSTEDFLLKDPEEMFRSCFLCKKVLEAADTVFMFGYMRAFCTPFCRAKQMEEEGVVLRTNAKASEVNPTYVEKKS